ncbi:hypothetical protein OR1_04105 [Geobacter sp. OR-1]|nr:hypothetical protein OR1_04105 [Geobacter sp. OR-1]
MDTATVEIAATARTGLGSVRKERMSPRVYLPAFRHGSATIRSTVMYATSQPTEYMNPSYP